MLHLNVKMVSGNSFDTSFAASLADCLQHFAPGNRLNMGTGPADEFDVIESINIFAVDAVVKSFNFDVSTTEGKLGFADVRENHKRMGSNDMESWGGKGSHYLAEFKNGKSVLIETKCLFDNQSNTRGEGDKNGLRVFDLAIDAYLRNGMGVPSKDIKRGHYVEFNQHLLDLREYVKKCGYCGKQSITAKDGDFCPHCIDSEYLRENDLPLTRMQSIKFKGNRAPLTEQELLDYLPKYRQAQLHGTTERGIAYRTKQRVDLVKSAEKTIKHAEIERDGKLWLLDNGAKIENCIYYNHRGVFTFGWQKTLSRDMADTLTSILVEFPFEYEIKLDDNSVLSKGIQ